MSRRRSGGKKIDLKMTKESWRQYVSIRSRPQGERKKREREKKNERKRTGWNTRTKKKEVDKVVGEKRVAG